VLALKDEFNDAQEQLFRIGIVLKVEDARLNAVSFTTGAP
jgi:hypothetical protein